MDNSQSLPRFLSKTFFKGLAIVIPVTVAGYVLVWVFSDAESFFKSLMLLVLPEAYYIPGLGLVAFLIATFFLGLLMYPLITRSLLKRTDRLFRRIPLFGNIYSPVKDLFELFGGDMAHQLGRPVMIKVPNTEMETLGFVTRRTNENLPDGMIPDNHLVVFVQWSSQIGGYCFIVPEDAVRPLDLTVEQGMRWALTAGLSGTETTR